MSDRMRWRYADTNPVVAAVDYSTMIEIGDLLYQSQSSEILHRSLRAFPASDFPLSSGRLPGSRFLANIFLGVAMQRSRPGDKDAIRVATTGVFDFDCPSGIFELGDLVGVGMDCERNVFFNQQVMAVSIPACAIARVAKRVAAAANSVLVDIRSTVMTGGIRGTTV